MSARRRLVHAIAAIANGAMLAAALAGFPRVTVVAAFASILLLLWSLEQDRVGAAREKNR